MKANRRNLLVIVPIVVAATIFLGSGTSYVVPRLTLERDVARVVGNAANLGPLNPRRTSCPRDLPARVGATERCVVRTGSLVADYSVLVRVDKVTGSRVHIEMHATPQVL